MNDLTVLSALILNKSSIEKNTLRLKGNMASLPRQNETYNIIVTNLYPEEIHIYKMSYTPVVHVTNGSAVLTPSNNLL